LNINLRSSLLLIICPLFFFARLCSEALIDFDEMEQAFVLETKKITVSGYPDAFNPSIIRWNGHLLMSFRARNNAEGLSNVANLIGFVWLDENYEPVAPAQILSIEGVDPFISRAQDPRLIAINDNLYMVYSDLCDSDDGSARRVFISEIFHDGDLFIAQKPEILLDFEGDWDRKFEKNWVPFDYNHYLLLSYSIFPHKVFLPLFGEKKCVTVDFTESFNQWRLGDIRGGTQALLVDGQYLSFFHSSKQLASVQSNGKRMMHYFIGAYTFNSSPPFNVNKISPDPIIGRGFYEESSFTTWKPMRVVFPGGFVFDKRNIWIVYGRQDSECWVVKIDKEALFKSLVPLESVSY
jgi:predicted GH43/DUF377 family glycosyl hydrolase